jgi:hypothetical protein
MTPVSPQADWLPPTPNASKGDANDSAGAPRPDYGWNDTGNADRLAHSYGEDLIYCHERQTYYVWNGQRWQFDEFIQVERRAEQTIKNAFAEAGSIDDKDKRKAFFSFLNKRCAESAPPSSTVIHGC